MVRQAGNAPASSVWKTEILLLNDWRMKGKAAGVGIAPTFPVLQTGANLSQLSSESGACDRCCSDFIFRSTGERPCCWTSHAKSGPPRCRAVLCRLRGDCITAMLAGRKSSSLNLRQLLGLIRTVLYSMSYRRESGGPGGSCNLTMTD
jgi:hypothetical protein